MKQTIVGVVFTAFIYFLFASINHSWNTMLWSGKSIFFFGLITIIGWAYIVTIFFLTKKYLSEAWEKVCRNFSMRHS
jgi:hypothetical protein